MLYINTGVGTNPHVVNVISFCGHGITIGGDSFALIPGTKLVEGKERHFLYPLNLSRWAREFAKKEHSMTIIIFSGCRN